MKYFKIFIETNILLSLAAVFLSAGSALQFGEAPQLRAYLVLIFFGIFLAYNANQIPGIIQNKKAPCGGYTKRVRENRLVFYSLFAFALLGLFYSGFFVKTGVLVTLVFVSIISLLYSFPVIPYKGTWYTLREIHYLKIFLIVIVWSVATVFLPAVQLGVPLVNAPVLLVFAERVIFLFALAILFDSRDMESDKRANLRTIPLLMGERKAFMAANVLLFLFLAISLVHYTSTSTFVLPAFVISGLTTFIFIYNTKIKTIPYFHYRIFDCTLLVQPLLVFIFYYLGKTTL